MHSHVSENFCMYCGIKYCPKRLLCHNAAKIEPTKEEPSMKLIFFSVGEQINRPTKSKWTPTPNLHCRNKFALNLKDIF